MLNRKVVSIQNGIAGVFVFLSLLVSTAASAQAPFIGEIRMFSGNYCPKGWMEADGRELKISNHQALYSLLSNYYGGDGRVNFRLPDLRGRVAMGLGQGPGLSHYTLGETGGRENVTLSTQEMPSHSHGVSATKEAGSNNASVAAGAEGKGEVLEQPVQSAGMSMPHENRPPYLVVRYCVNTDGMYPSRP